MKNLSTILQCLGTILMVIVLARIFGAFEQIITTDIAFVLLILSSLEVTLTGFLFETYAISPISSFQLRKKNDMLGNLWFAIGILMIVITILTVIKLFGK